MRKIFFILNLYFIPHAISAQSSVQSLYVEKKEYTCDSTFNISIRSTQLNKTIAMQGTIQWDTAVLQYTSIIPGTSGLSLNESNMNLGNVAFGYLNFLWYDNNLIGLDAPTDTALFYISFRRKGFGSGRGNISFVNSPTPLEIVTLDFSGTPQKNNDAVFNNGYIITPDIYVFSGVGNWSDAQNWTRGRIPPDALPECSEVLIDPAGEGECLMNIPFTVLPGAKMQVKESKRLRVNSNLTIRQ